MSEHTPGPWTLRKSDTARPESRRMDIVTAFGEFAPAFIAGDALPEDARLISAAPEMLIAVCQLRDYLQTLAGEIQIPSSLYLQGKRAMDSAESAIAKAERRAE